MPVAAPRWCSFCRSPHPAGIECPVGRAARMAAIDRRRPGPRRRLYDAEWDRERAAWLREHRWCVICGAPAREVHHTTPHRGDPAIFWDKTRWQSRCRSCHSSATMTENNERRRAR